MYIHMIETYWHWENIWQNAWISQTMKELNYWLVQIAILFTCLFILSSSELRAHVLTAFQELMEHGIVTWDLINNVFVKKVHFIIDTIISKRSKQTIGNSRWSQSC